jgi:hypothetical protein
MRVGEILACGGLRVAPGEAEPGGGEQHGRPQAENPEPLPRRQQVGSLLADVRDEDSGVVLVSEPVGVPRADTTVRSEKK